MSYLPYLSMSLPILNFRSSFIYLPPNIHFPTSKTLIPSSSLSLHRYKHSTLKIHSSTSTTSSLTTHKHHCMNSPTHGSRIPELTKQRSISWLRYLTYCFHAITHTLSSFSITPPQRYHILPSPSAIFQFLGISSGSRSSTFKAPTHSHLSPPPQRYQCLTLRKSQFFNISLRIMVEYLQGNHARRKKKKR